MMYSGDFGRLHGCTFAAGENQPPFAFQMETCSGTLGWRREEPTSNLKIDGLTPCSDKGSSQTTVFGPDY